MNNYFTIRELTLSRTALKMLIDNTPTLEVQLNLQLLIDNILNPLREEYDKPIKVNSGYRCYNLNKFLRGADKSLHLKGQAADITGGNKSENKIIFDIILKLDLPFDLLINEKNYSWIHVSYSNTNNRKQILNLK